MPEKTYIILIINNLYKFNTLRSLPQGFAIFAALFRRNFRFFLIDKPHCSLTGFYSTLYRVYNAACCLSLSACQGIWLT